MSQISDSINLLKRLEVFRVSTMFFFDNHLIFKLPRCYCIIMCEFKIFKNRIIWSQKHSEKVATHRCIKRSRSRGFTPANIYLLKVNNSLSKLLMFPLFVDFDQAKARWGKCNCSEKTLQQSSQQNTCDSILTLVNLKIKQLQLCFSRYFDMSNLCFSRYFYMSNLCFSRYFYNVQQKSGITNNSQFIYGITSNCDLRCCFQGKGLHYS